MKAQHEGTLTPPCIVGKRPQVMKTVKAVDQFNMWKDLWKMQMQECALVKI